MKKIVCLALSVMFLLTGYSVFADEQYKTAELGSPLHYYTLNSYAAACEYNGEDYYFMNDQSRIQYQINRP